MTLAATDLSRRNFLTGRARTAPPPLRPPWTREEAIASACTGCGACIDACPEAILSPGSNGRPMLSFAENECTFCRACADACPEPVFLEANERAFAHVAAIEESCFAKTGVHCQSCGDACPETAIRFRPRLGGAPVPEIEAGRCTGCGACAAICPAHAIIMNTPETA
ncbi:ferredoxin-type protein NapF [Rhizobiales bacterium]|uniref:ferredoxin-type protein NapF n=1 Tax=Hongsoonwoonella zoysiae TaxID=2821844 RepID=UPI001560C89B|nr:ferredoxin-type protein NapF [Hongsoonwoonella zoysiae]NRG18191.1 ferredoxin-type protein NapF [Hongsoonwoonella zoysiae]